MDEEIGVVDTKTTEDTGFPESEPERDPMPPIESRFLYVDVAAQRAKQLRRVFDLILRTNSSGSLCKRSTVG